jgi:hypothetical protein
VPFAVIGKKWKLSFVGRSRQAKAVVRDLESGFSPKRQLSGQVRPLTTPNWTTAPGHDLPVRVTFQFLLLVCPVIEVSVRYSAIKLMTSLPRPGQERPVIPIMALPFERLLHSGIGMTDNANNSAEPGIRSVNATRLL